MSQTLHLAAHPDADSYWSGGEYELNLSFGTLRDKQWQRVMNAVWNHAAISGPFTRRFVPGAPADPAGILVPPPGAAQTQYGGLLIGSFEVGVGVLATRSLFECVSLQVPLGMFAGLEVGDSALHIDPLDRIYRNLALAVFDAVPFDLTNIGLQCECRLVGELQIDTQQRLELMARGSFFARDQVLLLLGVPPDDYAAVRPALRWIPPGA